MRRIAGSLRRFYEQTSSFVLQFGAVGIIAYFVDVAVFNVLRVGWLADGWWSSPVGATTIAMTVSTLVAWLGNRYWTFRRNRRTDVLRELIEFSLVATGGYVITVLCIWMSHDVLGFTSLLADNISRNVVGFVLATAFRFLAYRFWVYGDGRKTRISQPAD